MITFGFVLITSMLSAQIVNIPDPNFKNALLYTNCVALSPSGEGIHPVDLNQDGEIQVSEALTVNYLQVSNQDIHAIEGIEKFLNLKGIVCGFNNITVLDFANNSNLYHLSCSYNQLTQIRIDQNLLLTYLNCNVNNLQNLDVSYNINLEKLICGKNQLESIDVSNNINLITLAIYNNQLASINITNNINLKTVSIHNNQLTGIDVSHNLSLTGLYISNNNINTLDVYNNINLFNLSCHTNPLIGTLDFSQNIDLNSFLCYNTQLSNINIKNGNNISVLRMWAHDNPNLLCVQVDDVSYANAQYCNIPETTGWCKEETAMYSEDCNLGITEQTLQEVVRLYPNPVKNTLQISTQNKLSISTIKIYDTLGRLVLQKVQPTSFLDVSRLASGFLLVEIETNKGLLVKKIVKE